MVVALVASWALVGCGAGDGCQGFDLSLAVTTGGAASPLEAARHFAATDGQPGLPYDGWEADDGDRSGSTARSGRWVLHTVEGTDGTWFVDGGKSCG